jgi:hypothetical protein
MRIEEGNSREPGTLGSTLKRCFAISFGLVVFYSPYPLWPQSDRGVITGTVTDPSAAAVADATVNATNSATGVSYDESAGVTQIQFGDAHPRGRPR